MAMSSRERPPVPGEIHTLPDGDENDAPSSARHVLAKYLGYVLPEVAAINPMSALLLDQAISQLMESPPHDQLSTRKYS
jgi:hypothetical protein